MNDASVSGTGLAAIREMVTMSDNIIEELRAESFDPHLKKQLTKRYTITQAAEMVGRTTAAIRNAENAQLLPQPSRSANNRRVGYSLKDINVMRDHFGTRPHRKDREEPVILAVQNFKGGVGKSTLCTHLAQYLAERGYRVLVIDCDSQASTTTMFGFRPDTDLTEDDTLLTYFEHGGPESLDYAIRDTYWNGLQIIPANLTLYSSEYQLAAKSGDAGAAWLHRLRDGIRTVQHRYDVIIMDPPPALGMISLNVLRAANSLIVPTPPAMIDYHSTVTFFRMLEEVLHSVERGIGEPINYKFLKIVVSKFEEGKSAQVGIARMMRNVYQRYVLNAPLKDSAEIDNAGADWKTVYELDKYTTSSQVYKRCLSSLNAVCREIELTIRATWPSHHDALDESGFSVDQLI